MAKLDHINIHVVDGPRMVRFFEDIIGAQEGFRPPFDSPGHWIYVDGTPAIHLSIVERDRDFPQGMINHIAFGIYDYETIKARLDASGYPWKLAGIPDTEIGQFFVNGPQGLLLEVQYRRKP